MPEHSPNNSQDKKQTNTYFLDPESSAELARLIEQDQLLTKYMGGPVVGLPDPDTMECVLDLACGPGGWVLDVAFAYPHIEVAGIDISQTMISYASARARSQALANASFEIMDISKPLEFSDNTFDLINARFLVGVLHRTAWPGLLQECMRILKPGGVLRLTEFDGSITNSAACEQLNTFGLQALWKAGYGFSPDGRTLGMTPMLESLLRRTGYQQIQSRAHAINYSAGSEAWATFYHNYEIAGLLVKPLLLKLKIATEEEIQRAYTYSLIEMQKDDFCGLWPYLSAWGTKVKTTV